MISFYLSTLLHFMTTRITSKNTSYSEVKSILCDKTFKFNFFVVAAFHQVSGVNVKEVVKTWTLQMGLPVVTISRLDQEMATADQK